MMTEPRPSVIIIDDDPEMRDALAGLLKSVGLEVKALASVPEFLKSGLPARTYLLGARCKIARTKRP